ncbi:hypothetical protein BpHYR1_027804 [Brachionus plicatilis]|uniref:Uncharacterized protein n=1 Tax=Brachionus plicatilis TaxID=10195 RepID=A0A3M7P247_BRAPC|nr:hypothetical protein BpHYR1_027804 [Brachionus plicatilis]
MYYCHRDQLNTSGIRGSQHRVARKFKRNSGPRENFLVNNIIPIRNKLRQSQKKERISAKKRNSATATVGLV